MSENFFYEEVVKKNEILIKQLDEANQMQEELERKIFQLETLMRLNEELPPFEKTEVQIKIALDIVTGTLGITQGAVILYDSWEEIATVPSTRGLEKDEIDAVNNIVERLAESGDFKNKPLSQVLKGKGKRILKYLSLHTAVDIEINSRLTGVFVLSNKLDTTPYSAYDMEIIEAIAKRAGEMIHNRILTEKYLDSQREKFHIRGLFEQFVSPEIIESLLEGDEKFQLGGSLKNVTVLMADIRGFTELSEKLEPEETGKMLNLFFSEMTDVVFHYKGTVDKFIGDSIMAVFGVPVSYKDEDLDDHQRAILAGLDMQTKFKKLHFKSDSAGEIFEQIGLGVGISTGIVLAGSIGSGKRIDYTVVGPSPNHASRICFEARHGEVLIDHETYHALNEKVKIKSVVKMALKGVAEPVLVYSVEGLLK